MTAAAVIVVSLDTKAAEAQFLRNRLAEDGVPALILDFGIRRDPSLVPDIFAADVAEPGTADQLLNLACERFGRADVLINNTGLKSPRSTRRASGAGMLTWQYATCCPTSRSPPPRPRIRRSRELHARNDHPLR